MPEYSSTRLGNSVSLDARSRGLGEGQELTPASPRCPQLEANFFARVPPSERPLHLRPDVQRKEAASSADQATLKDDLAEEDKGGLELSSTTRGSAATGTPPLPSTAASSAAAATQELPEKSNKEYDRSLLLALNRTVFFRYVCLGEGSSCRRCAPHSALSTLTSEGALLVQLLVRGLPRCRACPVTSSVLAPDSG